MTMNKWVNGEVVPMTPEEEAEFEAARAPTPDQVTAAKKGKIANAERKDFAFRGAALALDTDMLVRIAVLSIRASRAKANGEVIEAALLAADGNEMKLDADGLVDLAAALGDHFMAAPAKSKAVL